MTYATQADLVTRFGAAELAQLTDPSAGTTIDAAVVARALADADAEIDAHLGTRYALPLAAVPTVLVRVASDMARYFLWDVQASDTVKERYKAAVNLLRSMASGETSLGDAQQLAAPAAGSVTVSVSAPSRVFSSDLLDTFSRT